MKQYPIKLNGTHISEDMQAQIAEYVTRNKTDHSKAIRELLQKGLDSGKGKRK